MTATDRLRRALLAEDDVLAKAQEIIAEHITSRAPDRDTLNRLIGLLA